MPLDKYELFDRGNELLRVFCTANGIPHVHVTKVGKPKWHFAECAYYRPNVGIQICLEKCAKACSPIRSRNWNWPCSTVDRTPYGVLCHELGHHIDMLLSEKKYRYSGDYGETMQTQSGEKPLTGYCPNPAEWFAEMFRLYVTNPNLLSRVRPRTHRLLEQNIRPVKHGDWLHELGPDVPERVIASNRNKMVI